MFTNSAEFGIISQRDYFDKDIANSENIDGYYIVEPNDFVYNPRISTLAPFGPVRRNKLDKSGAMSPLYYVFRTHNVDCGYLEYFFKTNRWHSFMHLNGNSGARSDRFAIRDEVFRDMPISMPQDIEEQKKVGDFFSTLELAITLHQREYYSLGFRRKRVENSQNTLSWEQRELGDMGETYTGLSGKTKEDFGHGDAKFVTYMNVFSNSIADLSMTESVEIDKKQNEVNYGDVFFTTSSETPDEVGMSSVWLENSDNTYLNSFCFGYRPSVKVNPYYMAYMLRSDNVRKNIVFLAQGISRYNISKNKMMEISVPLPNLEEQQKIGEFLHNLDSLITLHQREYFLLGFCRIWAVIAQNTLSWEQRKLGDIVTVYDGVHQTPNYQTSGVMFLSVENIATLKSNKYISLEDFKRDYKVYPQKNDILMTRIGDVGTTNVVTDNDVKAYYVSLALLKYKETNPFFLSSAIQSDYVQKGLSNRTLKTAIPMKINKDEIGQVDVMLPILADEQDLIGSFFARLDNLITLHQRE